MITNSTTPSGPFLPPPVPLRTEQDEQLTPLERKLRAMALALGEDHIQLADARWVDMLRDGVTVKLTIGRWRGEAKLEAEDLGLPEAETRELVEASIIELGNKRLLPKRILDALGSVESNARKCLERHSLDTFWGYFVPATAYQAWKRENEGYRARYLAIRDDIAANYDALVSELLTEYAIQAHRSYRYLKALDPDSMTGEEGQEEEGFVRMFVARIRAKIPTGEAIVGSFSYKTIPSLVPLPSMLAEERAAAERIVEQRQAERRDSQQREQMINEVLREARQQKAEMLRDFLSEAIAKLRNLVYEATTDVLASMQKNGGKLIGKSAAQLRNLIAEMEKLNFYNDNEMDEAIKRVQAVLDTVPKHRNVGDLDTKLRSIATICRATLLDLDEVPRSARDLGVADTPTIEMVRSARRELDIETQPQLIDTEPLERQGRDLGPKALNYNPEGGSRCPVIK